MKKLGLLAAGVAGAAAIVVPTALALAGTPSFNQRIPVRVPSQAAVVSYDDNGRPVERPPSRSTTPTQTPLRTRSAEPGDDNRERSSRSAEPGDDNRGRPSRSPEPGDDDGRRASRSAEPGDANGGSSADDNSGNNSDSGNSNRGERGGDDSSHSGGD